MLKVYTLSNCDTCRRATKWLRANGIEFQELAIRETPPSPAELRAALAAMGGERQRLFNVSGRDYREGKIGDRLADMSDAEAIGMLAKNGSLVKRPFAIGDGVARVGFKEPDWAAAFSKRR